MRLASETTFPYGWPGAVCYFTVSAGFEPQQIRGRDDMRRAVDLALTDQVQIYAAWPGRYRTDVFLIDEPGLLAEAIGAVRS